MLVVTGAAGFIGSCLVGRLNREGFDDILLVDAFGAPDKIKNLANKSVLGMVHRDHFLAWLDDHHRRVDYIFHLGARTDTTEQDTAIFDELNLHYSQAVWQRSVDYGIPLLYASSAATYGRGDKGYEDRHDLVPEFRPLNPYGQSKNDFDAWALRQGQSPPQWAGLKFFNVYGPNEYHKGRMASVIYHTFLQIQRTGEMKLFRSHRPEYADGHQMRDFIYVEDITSICLHFLQNRVTNGLYNAGTGKARTFLDLATATFQALGLAPRIGYIDTPEDIRESYQYYTRASMGKLHATGYVQTFTSLEDGIKEYVKSYLINSQYY